MLVALDDLQWLDPASAGVLQIALRRLRDEPVGLLATLRTAPELGRARSSSSARSRTERLERLSLGPLSLAALHRLLEERLGLELTRPELVRVQEATAGNPVLRARAGARARPHGHEADPGPGPAGAREPARAARRPPRPAARPRPSTSCSRPRRSPGRRSSSSRRRTGIARRVVEALEAAAREGVVELDDSRRPLRPSACSPRSATSRRRSGSAVPSTGALAERSTDVEERARHLALAADGPDAVVASDLDAAAEQAAARGATAAAAELSELAAELTPDDPALARQRRLRAANFHRLAGDGERAVAMLEQLLAEVPPGVERADVLFELASTLRADPQTTIERLRRGARRGCRATTCASARILGVPELDPRLPGGRRRGARRRARGAREGRARRRPRTDRRRDRARRDRQRVVPATSPRSRSSAASEIEERLGLQLEYNESPRVVAQPAPGAARASSIELARCSRSSRAKAAARGDETHAARRSSGPCACSSGSPGNWQLALDHATAAHELAEQIQHARSASWVGASERSSRPTSASSSRRARRPRRRSPSREEMSDRECAILSLGVLGRLELALGNLEAAGGYLRELPGAAARRRGTTTRRLPSGQTRSRR